MGIFSRLGDIVNSNVTALLDRAEDPHKVIRMIVQEMEDTLVEVRATAARGIAEKKQLQRRIDRAASDAEDWHRKAEFALGRDREDLARGALAARARLMDETEGVRNQLVELEETLNQTSADISQLESKLADAKKRERALASRRHGGHGHHGQRHRRHGHDDDRIRAAFQRFEDIENGLDTLEGAAEAREIGRKKSLEQEFAELAAEDTVERELAALREKLAQAGTDNQIDQGEKKA